MGFSNRCRGGVWFVSRAGFGLVRDAIVRPFTNKAEIIIHTGYQTSLLCRVLVGRKAYPALSLVVWTLKREVRAIGGCLGMYRR